MAEAVPSPQSNETLLEAAVPSVSASVSGSGSASAHGSALPHGSHDQSPFNDDDGDDDEESTIAVSSQASHGSHGSPAPQDMKLAKSVSIVTPKQPRTDVFRENEKLREHWYASFHLLRCVLCGRGG